MVSDGSYGCQGGRSTAVTRLPARHVARPESPYAAEWRVSFPILTEWTPMTTPGMVQGIGEGIAVRGDKKVHSDPYFATTRS